MQRLPGPAPDGARRHLHEGDVRPHRLREGGRRMVRPALGERPAERAERHRLGFHQLPPGRGHGRGVHPGQLLAERAAQTTVEHWLDQAA